MILTGFFFLELSDCDTEKGSNIKLLSVFTSLLKYFITVNYIPISNGYSPNSACTATWVERLPHLKANLQNLTFRCFALGIYIL